MRVSLKSFAIRFGLVTGALLYIYLLDWSYVNFVSPVYQYDGFVDAPCPFVYRAIAALIGVLPALWMPAAVRRPTQMVYWLLYLSVVVPSCVIPFHSRATDPVGLLWFCFCLIVCMAMIEMVYHVPLMRVVRPRLSGRGFALVAVMLSLLFNGIVISRFGFRFQLVGLESIYDVRGDYTQALAGASSLVAYSLSWQGNVMNMLFVSAGIVRRNPLLLAAGLGGQLFLFSITGFKSLLFSGLICLFIYLALHHRGRFTGMTVVWGLVSLVVLTLSLKSLFPESSAAVTLLAVFMQRTLAMPGLLTGTFYDFYSNNPPAYLGYSIFRSFVQYPYGLEPARLLGQLYFGNPETSANAHMWADAFCNFRTPGLFVFTGIYCVYCWLYDSCAKGRNMLLTTPFLAIPALALCNSGLLTTLLNHGLGLALLMVYLMPAERAPQVEPSVRGRNRVAAGGSRSPDAGLAGTS